MTPEQRANENRDLSIAELTQALMQCNEQLTEARAAVEAERAKYRALERP